jgi:multisubunit Na+/H+ antiporter MnhE subunit
MRTLAKVNFVYPLFLAIIWLMMVDGISTGGDLLNFEAPATVHLFGVKFAIDSFFIGYVLSYIVIRILLSVQENGDKVKLPTPRLYRVLIYIIRLNFEILMSARPMIGWILRPETINAGIVEVDLLDPDDNQVVAAMTAHNITVTMGQSVVKYDGTTKKLYVHCLDVDKMKLTIEDEQRERVRQAREVLGLD